jgi:hypothetical protein
MISQECHRSLPIGRGVFENWKYPLAFVVTDSTISGENLKLHVQKCLETFEEKGVKIIATVCDQGSNNRKCYTSLGVTKKNPYFVFCGRKVFAFFDTPHFVKSFRNILLNHNLKTPDGM